jgi:hypothetical protein
LKTSITPTYDSRKTGPRYWVTTWVGDRLVESQKALDDPFVRHTVYLSVWDLLRGLLRRRLTVEVLVGASPELMDDVLELDANALVPGRSRRVEFRQGTHQALKKFGTDQAFEEIVAREEGGHP